MHHRGSAHDHAGACRTSSWCGVLLALLLAAMPAHGQTYKRGDYHFDVAPPPAWVQVRSVASQWPASAPGARGERWRYWLMDSQVDRRHGQRSVYIDRAYEPVSQELVRQAGKYEISFNPEYQTLVLHQVALRRAGVWQQRLKPATVTLARRESDFDSSDMSTGEVSALIVLDDVRAGDVVRVSYTLSGSNPILAGMEAEKFNIDWYQPILARHARVWWDAGLPLDVRASAGAPGPAAVKPQGDSQSVSLDTANLASVYDEGAYPNWYSPVATLNVSVKRSWADVAAWARKLYPPARPLPADLQQRIAQWKALPDVDHRIAAALRSVQEEVRYFGVELGQSSHQPAEPADTWKRRYGDCKDKARLLATILGQMGIEAYPALVSASEGRGVRDWPASPSAFDHVIVQVRLPDTVLWLDATRTQQRDPLRSLSRETLGSALPVAPDTQALVDIHRQPAAVDRIEVDEHYVPDAQGRGVVLQLESHYQGSVAESLRQRLQAQSAADLARSYGDYYRRRFGEVEGGAPVVHDDERSGVLTISERYRLADPWVDPDSRAIDLEADVIGNLINVPRVARRSAPFAVGDPVDVVHTTRIDLPPGWSSLTPEVSGVLQDKAMSFDHRVKLEGAQVVLADHYRTLAQDVPAADFPRHFELMRKIHDQLFTRLSLHAPQAAGDAKQRDQRLENLLRGVMEQSDAQGK